MTSEVAHGKTTTERASLRPWNFWLSVMATIKPSSVDRPTTETTHTTVLSITVPNTGAETAALKLLKPMKPPTMPALEISLKASLKTMPIGKTTKIVISRMLGSSQTYGSHL